MKANIGGHVSAAGGVYKAVENARAIGATAFQIFGASPRQWQAKPVSEADAKRFRDELKDSGLGPVYLHAAYLVNLASSNKDTINKSIKSLTEHLKIARQIDARGLIFHLGSAKDISRGLAIQQTARGIRKVLAAVPGKQLLLMENSSGGGSKVGDELDEIADIFKKVASNRVKICLDTAHAFAAGIVEYDETKNIKKFFDDFDRMIGIKNLEVIHANDSRTKYGSNADRHENIGQGEIGIKGFRNLAKEKRLRGKSWILEVPGFDDLGPDKKNINILKKCFS